MAARRYNRCERARLSVNESWMKRWQSNGEKIKCGEKIKGTREGWKKESGVGMLGEQFFFFRIERFVVIEENHQGYDFRSRWFRVYTWFSILLVEEKKLLESVREAVGYMYYFNPWISEHILIRLKLMSTQSLFFPEYTTSSINKTEKDNSSSMKEVIK